MSQITLVYKISRFIPKTGQLTLCEYNTGGEVKAMAYLHTNGTPFVSGLMLAFVPEGQQPRFTFDRKVYEDDKKLSEAVASAKLSYSTNVDTSLIGSIDLEKFIKVPTDDWGVSTLRGFQLHVTVDGSEASSSQKGVFTHQTTLPASSLKIVEVGEDGYLHTGETINLLDHIDVYFNTRSEEKLSSEQMKEKAKANLDRLAARSNRRKTSSPSVSSVEGNPTSASIMDQLKAMAAAAASSDSAEPQVTEEKAEAKPSAPSRVSRFAQGGTL